MVNEETTQLLTVSQAAQKMGVSRQTIYTWINSKRIKTIRTPGGRLRIPENQLMVTQNQEVFAIEADDRHYKIIDISHLTPDFSEQMGTKEKYWFRAENANWYWNTVGDRFLFKSGRENTGENWAEKIAADLCELLGLPHALYELASYHGQKGVITPSFVDEGERLIPGNEVLALVTRSYDRTKRYRQAQHTLESVVKSMQNERIKIPKGLVPSDAKAGPLDVFIGYIMLDAWIANTDRHHENWGLITDSKSGELSLAPTFDHASSLGRNESDETKRERLDTKDKQRSIERYAERARSALYLSGNSERPMLTMEAFNEIAKIQPKAALFWQNKLRGVLVTDTIKIINKVPDEIMSEVSREFTIRFLEINRDRILSHTIIPGGA